MRSNNPAFNRSPAFNSAPAGYGAPQYAPADLQHMYDRPSAGPLDTGRMTLDDVIMRTAAMFAVLLAAAAVGWMVPSPLVVFGGFIAAFVLGLVITFKQSTNPGLILTYAAVEGLFVGAVSNWYSYAGENLIGQAVIGTLVAFSVMLVAYRTGLLRATGKFKKFMYIAIPAYCIIGLLSFVSSLVGFGSFYSSSPFGILLSLVGVTLASLTLILDFDFIENGIRQGVPQRFAWFAAFGLVVTLVWLYLEILRLLSIFNSD